MKDHVDIYTLAIRYFEGKILRSEEKELFQYLQESESNYAEFKSWEHEWLLSSSADMSTEEEWRRLQNKMCVEEALQSVLPTTPFVFWKKIAAVAVIILLTAGATLGIWNTLENLRTETYFTLKAPYGEKSRVALADGTVVWLNAGSTLQYSNRFNDKHRKVKLNGEAYFEVAKKGGKLFTVETAGYDVVVKGTKFDVSAYSEDTLITTTLIEGHVELQYKNKVLDMIPGESLTLNRYAKTFSRKKVNAHQSNAWSEGNLIFDSITLKELAKKLSRQYNVDIKIQSSSLAEKTFRISLRNKETIEEVTEALQELLSVTIEHKDKYIYIRE